MTSFIVHKFKYNYIVYYKVAGISLSYYYSKSKLYYCYMTMK